MILAIVQLDQTILGITISGTTRKNSVRGFTKSFRYRYSAQGKLARGVPRSVRPQKEQAGQVSERFLESRIF